MKKNRIITVISIILIIAILSILGLLLYNLFKDSVQTNNNLEFEEQNNQASNTIQSPTNEEQPENESILEPIIVPPNNTTQEKESIVSTYFYSQLDETAKEIYDGLKENKENLISGNYIINYNTTFNTLLNTEGGQEKLNQALQSAWNAFSYDNMDLFYIDATKLTLTNEYHNVGGITSYRVSIGPGENNNYFLNTFNSREEVVNATNYLENIKRQMIEQLAADDDYTKIAKVHNWLIYFINYESDENSKDQHTIYGALKNRAAVCEGYARAFKYFMDGVGIPCLLVPGTGRNSQDQVESHAWNYVQIDNTWYAIDVTWDDPIVIDGGEQTEEMRNKYFLKGSEEFFKDHTEDGKITANSITFSFPRLSTQDYTR